MRYAADTAIRPRAGRPGWFPRSRLAEEAGLGLVSRPGSQHTRQMDAATSGNAVRCAAITAGGRRARRRPAVEHRPMRIGVQLPEVERRVSWPEQRAIALAADAAGFDSIWLGDHLLYRGDGRPERGPWEAWTLLAALAAATQRVRLGPLVACAAFHPPGLLAKMAATIDEI